MNRCPKLSNYGVKYFCFALKDLIHLKNVHLNFEWSIYIRLLINKLKPYRSNHVKPNFKKDVQFLIQREVIEIKL